MSKTQFRKRVRGTPKQIGQPFPLVVSKLSKPVFERRALTHGRMPLTPLEKRAVKAEDELLRAGYKGWMISIEYKDGTSEDIPLIARTFDEAMKKAKKKMNQSPDQIQELVLVDPAIGEILHKIGAGARKVAGAIGRGAWRGIKALARVARKVPSAAERAAIRAAREVGRIEAIPAEMREAYEEARAERPWVKEEVPIREYLEREPELEPAVRRLPPRIAREVAPRRVRTEAEWRAEPTPEIYKPAPPAPRAPIAGRPFAAPHPLARRVPREEIDRARKEIRELEPPVKRRARTRIAKVVVEHEPEEEGGKIKPRALPFWKQTRRTRKGYRKW